MSDSVANAGIEDVLSSVKRLVSEDARKPETDIATVSRKPGRLVLTDALRVSTPAASENAHGPLKLEAKYSTTDSAQPMLLKASDIVLPGRAANEDDASTAVRIETAKPDDPTDSLSAKIEALEAAIARTEDQWEPDGDSNDAYSGTPTHALYWASVQEFQETDQFVPISDSEDVSPTEVDEEFSEDEGPAPQPVATFVRHLDVSAPQEPQDASAMDETDTETETEETKLGDTGLTPSEEEALRDMISDVVREQLQGALGERITRNVRKMVRREIHRALVAQDLK